jgi:low affinity Fe/Cu permease
MAHKKRKEKFFERLAAKATQASGSTPAIIISFSLIIVWIISGPFFNYSQTWQLIINTGTTIITFLMVFLIQKSQNKDSVAMHIKLNELVAANDKASNRLVDVEDLTEEELVILEKFYCRLKEKAQKENSLLKSHSIDEHENNTYEDKLPKTKNIQGEKNQA